MRLPIKYKIENGYLWATMGITETWTKCFYLYGEKVAGVLNQGFGSHPEIYSKFGLDGHNGLDLYAQTGTCLYSPIDAKVTEVQIDDNGYGHHLRIAQDGVEMVFGHLKDIFVKLGDTIKEGQLIALTDNTGFSTGAHLHWGKRLLDKSGSILNYGNGYLGSVNFTDEVDLTIEETTDLEKLYQYADARGQKYSLFFGWNGKEELAIACKKLGITGRVTQGSYYDYILLRRKNNA